MTDRDAAFFRECYKSGLVRAPFLDVGSMKVNDGLENLKDLAKTLGVTEAVGADFAAGPGVDVIADFSRSDREFAGTWTWGHFATVAIFNVLEHTFDPLTVLRNALSLVEPGGALLVVTPSTWPIHNYPVDCLRFNPDWFRQFAIRHNLATVDDLFCWISEDFGIVPVAHLCRDGLDHYPTFHHLGGSDRIRLRMTYAVNRLFPTFFRTHWLPAMSALGAAWTKPAPPRPVTGEISIKPRV